MTDNPAILYVEDEASSRKVMRMLLQGRLGLENVTIFEDSANVLERAMALSPTPEIILLDIHMQPHDGFEVLKLLRSTDHFQESWIIALTASVMNEEIQQLQKAGFDGCIGKPINVDTFSETLRKIIEGDAVWQVFN